MFTEKQKELFWSHVDINGPGDCWNWTMALDRNGYGKVKIGGKYYISHRAAYQISTGKTLDSSIFLLHSCDNPVCCNPKHLAEGDHLQNMRDKKDRGRSNSTFHPRRLSLEIAREIRREFSAGTSKLKIGRMFGIVPQNVRKILSNQYWKEPVTATAAQFAPKSETLSAAIEPQEEE